MIEMLRPILSISLISTSHFLFSLSDDSNSDQFALELEGNEVFKDELRLWRSISSLIPDSYLSQSNTSPSTIPTSTPIVPPMIIDVVLDTSSLRSDQILMISNPIDPASKVRVDGMGIEIQAGSTSTSHQKLIVLESWRLDFE